MTWKMDSYFWLLLLLPFLLGAGIYAIKRRQRIYNRNVGKQFFKLIQNVSRIKQYIKFSFMILGIIFLIIALAGPMYGERSRVIQKTGVDIIIALDISKSMLAEDIIPSRIERAKMELSSFIKELQGDQVGIIAFSGVALPRSPLTTDYSISQLVLKGTQVGDIPYGGTNLAQAINTARDLFKEGSRDRKRSRILIVVSDGEKHQGDIQKAAELARKDQITIYTIGIGSSSGELIPLKKNGKRIGYLEDDGKPVVTKLNPDTLKKIASITGGSYYGFNNNAVDFEAILNEIAQFEKRALKEESKVMKVERYQIPLGIALCFIFIGGFISERQRSNGGGK